MTRASSGVKVYRVREGMRKLQEYQNCATLLPATSFTNASLIVKIGFQPACKKSLRLIND
jgi:hypothetical protein